MTKTITNLHFLVLEKFSSAEKMILQSCIQCHFLLIYEKPDV